MKSFCVIDYTNGSQTQDNILEAIVENIICDKTKDTKQRPTPFFVKGLIATQLLSNYMKQDQGSVSDCGHQSHPSVTFSFDLHADTQ